VTLDVRFRLEPYPDLRDLSPFVDPYGQSRYGLWPCKVTADDDLLASHTEESGRLDDWLRSSPFDSCGGYLEAGWSEDATGFYRLTLRDGFWWLVSPDGNPCFYTGVCTVPQLAGEKPVRLASAEAGTARGRMDPRAMGWRCWQGLCGAASR